MQYSVKRCGKSLRMSDSELVLTVYDALMQKAVEDHCAASPNGIAAAIDTESSKLQQDMNLFRARVPLPEPMTHYLKLSWPGTWQNEPW